MYRLAAALLGVGHRRLPRWLLVARADEQVGFAVENIEAYLQVAPSFIPHNLTPLVATEPFSTETLLHRTIARPCSASQRCALRSTAQPRRALPPLCKGSRCSGPWQSVNRLPPGVLSVPLCSC